jgi:hypothetical protein
MAATKATKEAIWLKSLLIGLVPMATSSPITIYCNNQGAIALADNPLHYERSKHIDIQYHYVREAIQNHKIRLVYLPTEQMRADRLTKLLVPAKFTTFQAQLNLQPVSSRVGMTMSGSGQSQHGHPVLTYWLLYL